MERDEDLGYPVAPPLRRCGWCDEPMEHKRGGAVYCSRQCKSSARRARKNADDQLLGLKRRHPLADASLMELYEQSAPPVFVRTDEDFVLPGGDDDLDDADEHDTGIREFLGQADNFTRRAQWKYWSILGKRHGVQPAEQVADRVERRRASMESNINRLKNAPNQVEQRHVPASRGAVARAGRASRELNSHYRRASDMPPPDMQGPVSDVRRMPQAINRGDRGSRAYSWQMRDGW